MAAVTVTVAAAVAITVHLVDHAGDLPLGGPVTAASTPSQVVQQFAALSQRGSTAEAEQLLDPTSGEMTGWSGVFDHARDVSIKRETEAHLSDDDPHRFQASVTVLLTGGRIEDGFSPGWEGPVFVHLVRDSPDQPWEITAAGTGP